MSLSLRGWLVVGAPVMASLLWASQASADAAGDKVLVDMESSMNRAKTQSFEYEAINQEPGKPEKKLGLKVLMKGEKRLTEFVAPADMKGTKVLILSTTQMYVYLPAFGKVRRIASHTADQGFMGLAFSQDDFATQKYSGDYSAKLLSDGASEWKIEATTKEGKTTPYAKIEFTVAKDNKLPTEIKYFNAEGKHLKTETRSGYSCEGNICTPGELKMVDHMKGGLWTKMVRKSWKLNGEISDEIFSKRSLEK